MHPQTSVRNFSTPSSAASMKPQRGVSDQTWNHFSSTMRTTRRRRGDWVFALGDPADSIYFLQKGRMKITALSEDGQEVLHEVVGPGEFFGATSAILRMPRTTSAQALETCLVGEIHLKDLERLLGMYPEVSLQLLKSVGLRLKKAEAQLVNIICNDISGRVREALIDLMRSESSAADGPADGPIRIKMTQQDLANLIGASRQKTSQALKELENSGVLRLLYGSILITHPRKLRD